MVKDFVTEYPVWYEQALGEGRGNPPNVELLNRTFTEAWDVGDEATRSKVLTFLTVSGAPQALDIIRGVITSRTQDHMAQALVGLVSFVRRNQAQVSNELIRDLIDVVKDPHCSVPVKYLALDVIDECTVDLSSFEITELFTGERNIDLKLRMARLLAHHGMGNPKDFLLKQFRRSPTIGLATDILDQSVSLDLNLRQRRRLENFLQAELNAARLAAESDMQSEREQAIAKLSTLLARGLPVHAGDEELLASYAKAPTQVGLALRGVRTLALMATPRAKSLLEEIASESRSSRIQREAAMLSTRIGNMD